MFKAVLFDLDNTLIDFTAMKRASCMAAVTAMVSAGVPLERKKAFEELFALYGVHGIENTKIFQKFLKKFLGKIDYRILSKGISAYRKVQHGFLEPYPGVRSTLVRLKEKSLKLGIITDAPRLKAWVRLAEMNLEDFFDTVVTLDDTKKLKPHKIPFQKAIKELEILPSEILFVGDNPGRDILGAKRAGMKTALAKYGQVFKNSKISADFELKKFSDLLKII
ncbi:MAG: HAD-IA family hydrolase [Candidatus Diapherotrites archaeon]|nr:HAD-IA family hydrolase [Candidatus Diapherotrites archaeon]